MALGNKTVRSVTNSQQSCLGLKTTMTDIYNLCSCSCCCIVLCTMYSYLAENESVSAVSSLLPTCHGQYQGYAEYGLQNGSDMIKMINDLCLASFLFAPFVHNTVSMNAKKL